MEFILAIFVLVAALALLAYPLYRARPQPAGVNAATLDDLLAQRDGVYATLRDLELDRQLGKLDDADYQVLHERYMRRAADVLQDLDTLHGEGKGAEASVEIEKEIAAMRRQATPLVAQKDEPVPTTANGQSLQMLCSNCGRTYIVGDKFCARCGHALS